MRSGMSMIELVISIVVMGIVVASLPTILLQTQNNNAFAMQQEAIAAARTKLGDILTYQWDENDYDANASSVSMVIDVTNGNPALDRNSTVRRIGHVLSDSRRKFFAINTPPTGIVDGLNDIDDFHGENQILTIAAAGEVAAGGLDYLFDINLTTTVGYMNDTANYTLSPTLVGATFSDTNVTGSTNAKIITVSVTSSNNDVTSVTLRAYSFNIGGNQILPPRAYNP